MYSVLNTLLLLVFKIAVSLQCILKPVHKMLPKTRSYVKSYDGQTK